MIMWSVTRRWLGKHFHDNRYAHNNQRHSWKWCFLCGSTPGYITRTSDIS
jgi:hypothetical protein